LAQIEKQALSIQALAQGIQVQIQASKLAGRPVGLAILLSDLAQMESHMKRLESSMVELEGAGP
jgi:hypothetical protein